MSDAEYKIRLLMNVNPERMMAASHTVETSTGPVQYHIEAASAEYDARARNFLDELAKAGIALDAFDLFGRVSVLKAPALDPPLPLLP